MFDEQSFRDLLQRVRSGDSQAAAELVREYEPEIRRAVRLRLSENRLRRVLDSMDICQSVLANFFVRASAGQFDLERPEQLLALLVTMARNRLLDHARRYSTERRDQQRVVSDNEEQLAAIADPATTPSQILSERELAEAVRRQLTEEERYLAEQRAEGRDWADLARELGNQPDAIRKKLSRAIDRAVKNLGLDALTEENDER